MRGLTAVLMAVGIGLSLGYPPEVVIQGLAAAAGLRMALVVWVMIEQKRET